jgi:DNA-binding response OmpR family regulator
LKAVFRMHQCVLLHVEDDDGSDFLFRFALDEAHITASVYRVLTAENAIQFLRKESPYERARSPRLIVLDVTLPLRDGLWLLGEIKKDPNLQSIPVVVLGIEPGSVYAPKVLALGAQCYIEKSFNFNVFSQQVKAACEFLNLD